MKKFLVSAFLVITSIGGGFSAYAYPIAVYNPGTGQCEIDGKIAPLRKVSLEKLIKSKNAECAKLAGIDFRQRGSPYVSAPLF